MYGLLLDSIQKFLCYKYGEKYWENIRRKAKLKNQWFVTHEVYSDNVIIDLVNAASSELEVDTGTVMKMFGEYFAQNIGHYGYARLLRVLGRDLRDFLNGLDDLHEYLRFSYPQMHPPSFFCESETEAGLILHYTTMRSGYLEYVIGQLTTVGRIYGKELEITVLSKETTENSTCFTLDLKFDNQEFLCSKKHIAEASLERNFSIGAETFLGVFPFCVLFDRDLVIWKEGTKLEQVLPGMVGSHFLDCFTIRKPTLLDKVSWKQICLHANCVFELLSVDQVTVHKVNEVAETPMMPGDIVRPQLKLKGQMLPLPDMDTIAFLCSPVMSSPEELYESGIFVNDLSMHDSSRDIILAGSQKDPELMLALSQEKIRSAQLEDSIQQTDRLLFHMIPKPIADQLRRGETPLNTCKEFPSVSILFSDIVSFTPMCSRLHPMEVVCVLNAMYVAYDKLCEKNHVYKLETIGDAYMVVCGAPVCTLHHAEFITNFAMDIIKATRNINDPSTQEPLQIRVGIHSGNVVAGVVGSTVLRYDVFGDTVNVAARMEATGKPMQIHISETTAHLLNGTPFEVKARGPMDVKGKGRMNTYWVTGKKKSEPSTSTPLPEVDVSPTTQPSPPPAPSPQPPSPPPPPSPHSSSDSALQQPVRHRHSLTVPPSSPRPTTPNRLVTSPQQQRQHRKSTPLSPLPSSPRPDEWPQAAQQLSKFSPLEPEAMDHTVPPGEGSRGGAMSRRHTAPTVPPYVDQSLIFSSSDQELPLSSSHNTDENLSLGSSDDPDQNLILTNPFHTTPEPTIPLSQINSTLWHQRRLMKHMSVDQDKPHPSSMEDKSHPSGVENKPHPSGMENTPHPSDLEKVCPFMSNLGSTPRDENTSPYSEELLEMEQFALQAAKNAKQAAQLADWAASMVQRLKRCGGMGPPVGGTRIPVGGTRAPVGGTRAPVGGTRAPVGGTQTPVEGIRAPVGGTQAPVGGTQAPAGGTQAPVGGTQAPAGGTQAPVGGTQAPVGASIKGTGDVAPFGTPVDQQNPPPVDQQNPLPVDQQNPPPVDQQNPPPVDQQNPPPVDQQNPPPMNPPPMVDHVENSQNKCKLM